MVCCKWQYAKVCGETVRQGFSSGGFDCFGEVYWLKNGRGLMDMCVTRTKASVWSLVED